MPEIKYITSAQARRLLAEQPPRYGVAHTRTSETILKGSKRSGHYGVEVLGELLYAYDLATGEPVNLEK